MVAVIEIDVTGEQHVDQGRNVAPEAAAAAGIPASFTARSVVASLLLGMRGAEMSGADLVRSAGLLGVAEGTTRVALSRMVAAGELLSEAGSYRLTGALLDRHGWQESGRHPMMHPWDGTWRVAVVGAGGAARTAAQRSVTRRYLEASRLAEWREGVWARPDNLTGPVVAVEGCTWLTGCRFVEHDAPLLAARLWDTARWSLRARDLREAMRRTAPEGDLAAGFRLSADVVRHLRDDPLLPPALLPGNWPGTELRRDYDRYETRFWRALRQARTPTGD
ncbi:MAG: PaaX family transcriptional regulator C-terminal domain-containing protein [Acidimicrobiales bacterium]